MAADSEKVALLSPQEEDTDDLETLDAVAKARSIYIEPEHQATDVEFHQALALRAVISNSTVYCIVLFVLAGFIVLGAALLGLLLAPPQKIPLKGYKVTTSVVNPIPNWWNDAIFTDEWIIISSKGVSPVQLDNSTALWIFGETTYQIVNETTPDGNPKNVTIPSSILFLSIEPASRQVVNAYFVTDEDGFPKPILPQKGNDSVIIPAASIVLNKVYYQWYKSVKRNTGFHVSTGLAVDDNGDPFVDLQVVYSASNSTPPTIAMTNGSSNSYVYFFFAKQDSMFSSQTLLYVARLSVGQLTNISAPFEYWAGGDNWNIPGYNVPTLDSIGTSFSITWNPYCQLYLTLDTGPGTRAVLRSSVTVYKDYTLPMTLYPTSGESTELLTTAQWHPELFESDGRVMYASVYSGSRPYPSLLKIELTPDSS